MKKYIVREQFNQQMKGANKNGDTYNQLLNEKKAKVVEIFKIKIYTIILQ